MSVVVDAYAVVAALVGEPARRDVEPHLPTALISASNLAEVIDVCIRVHRNEENAVRERIDWLLAGGLQVVPLERQVAVAAGALRARRYDRRNCLISLGDCVAVEVARSRRLPLATSDPHLAGAAWAEEIEVLALPDSHGRRPRRR